MLLHEARKVDTRKFEYGKLGSIEEGQIILIKPWVNHHHVFNDVTNLISSYTTKINTATKRTREFLCLGLAMEC